MSPPHSSFCAVPHFVAYTFKYHYPLHALST